MKNYKTENANLKKLINYWTAAYYEMDCYFDSISDEEKPKVAKRLERIFKKIDKYEGTME